MIDNIINSDANTGLVSCVNVGGMFLLLSGAVLIANTYFNKRKLFLKEKGKEQIDYTPLLTPMTQP